MSTVLTAERLRELLHYDPETGVFTRAVSSKNGRWRKGTRTGCLFYPRTGGAYVLIRVDGHLCQAHRLAWLYMTGEWPKDEIDHRDIDGTNNKWKNLREATGSLNAANKRKQSNNTSGFKGVFFQRGLNKFRACVTCRGQRHYLGCFTSAADAHAAYAEAARRLFGEFARAE